MIAAGVVILLAIAALAGQHLWWEQRWEKRDAAWQAMYDTDTGALEERNTALVVEAASHHVLMHRAADRVNDLEIFLAVATERAEAAETALRGELERQARREAETAQVPLLRMAQR